MRTESSFQLLGKQYISSVTCTKGKCKATNPNIKDACKYICGAAKKTKCTEQGFPGGPDGPDGPGGWDYPPWF